MRSIPEDQSQDVKALKSYLVFVSQNYNLAGIISCQRFSYHLNKLPTYGDDPDYCDEDEVDYVFEAEN